MELDDASWATLEEEAKRRNLTVQDLVDLVAPTLIKKQNQIPLFTGSKYSVILWQDMSKITCPLCNRTIHFHDQTTHKLRHENAKRKHHKWAQTDGLLQSKTIELGDARKPVVNVRSLTGN